MVTNQRLCSTISLRSGPISGALLFVVSDDMKILLLLLVGGCGDWAAETGSRQQAAGPGLRVQRSPSNRTVWLLVCFRPYCSCAWRGKRPCLWIWTSWGIKSWSTSLFWRRAAPPTRRSSSYKRPTGSSRWAGFIHCVLRVVLWVSCCLTFRQFPQTHINFLCRLFSVLCVLPRDHAPLWANRS